jgi:hypothetical protein
MYDAGYNQQTYLTEPDSSVLPPVQQQEYWTGDMQQNQQNIYAAGYNQHTDTASPDSNIQVPTQQLHLTGAVQGNQTAGALTHSSSNTQTAGYIHESNTSPAGAEASGRRYAAISIKLWYLIFFPPCDESY